MNLSVFRGGWGNLFSCLAGFTDYLFNSYHRKIKKYIKIEKDIVYMMDRIDIVD